MNKVISIVFLLVLFSCNKEKRNNKFLAGDWNIVDYSEIIFDGTTNEYNVVNGTAHFDDLRDKKEGNFTIDLYAVNSNDTVNHDVSGTFRRRSLDTLELKIDNSVYLFDINRIFKEDLNLQGGLLPNRKGVYIMKKK